MFIKMPEVQFPELFHFFLPCLIHLFSISLISNTQQSELNVRDKAWTTQQSTLYNSHSNKLNLCMVHEILHSQHYHW